MFQNAVFYFNENIIIQHVPFSLPELRIQLDNHHQQSGELLSMLMMFSNALIFIIENADEFICIHHRND